MHSANINVHHSWNTLSSALWLEKRTLLQKGTTVTAWWLSATAVKLKIWMFKRVHMWDWLDFPLQHTFIPGAVTNMLADRFRWEENGRKPARKLWGKAGYRCSVCLRSGLYGDHAMKCLTDWCLPIFPLLKFLGGCLPINGTACGDIMRISRDLVRTPNHQSTGINLVA